MGARNWRRAVGKSVGEILTAIEGWSGKNRFVDTGTRTDDIRASEVSACNVEHAFQMLPIPDIGRLEDRFGGGLRIIGMVGHHLLSFWAKG